MTATPTFESEADAAAARAAENAGIEIRLLSGVTEITKAVELLETIWNGENTRPPANVETLRALSTAGSYVGGAFEGDELVATSFGFLSTPADKSLHSHIAGVSAQLRGRSVGFALKVHQRAWAMHRGVESISWTFDPLIRRNAHFNLIKLGARAGRYFENFYGHMGDTVNGDDDTDRLYAVWRLADPAVVAAARGEYLESTLPEATPLVSVAADGAPLRHETDASLVSVALPADIETLRVTSPVAASAWRAAVRDTVGNLMTQGATVLGFNRNGQYIIDRGEQ